MPKVTLKDLENHPVGAAVTGYDNFLGIGKTRKKRKKVAGKTALAQEAGTDFKGNMQRSYNLIKDPEQTSIAIANLDKEKGLENIFAVVKDFGTPVSKSQLAQHNARVKVYIKYDYANADDMDCEELDKAIEVVDAEVEAANKRAAAEERGKGDVSEIQALANVQAKFKKLYASQSCQKKTEEAQSAKEQQETLTTLKQATQATGKEEKQDKTFTYIAYGIAGLVVVIGVTLLLKRK